MQTPANIPHGTTLELWHGLVVSLILGSAGWVKLWLNRRKPSEVDADNQKRLAEARKLDVDASTALGEVIVAMSARALDAQAAIDAQHARHAKATEYLQKQIEHRQEQEEDARRRAHNAVDEVNRCVKVIKQYELMMSEKIEFNPFIVKTYKEIMGEDESA